MAKMSKTEKASKRVAAEFEDLAQRTSEDAACIKCPVDQYREGLETIIEMLQSDLAAARSSKDENEL